MEVAVLLVLMRSRLFREKMKASIGEPGHPVASSQVGYHYYYYYYYSCCYYYSSYYY